MSENPIRTWAIFPLDSSLVPPLSVLAAPLLDELLPVLSFDPFLAVFVVSHGADPFLAVLFVPLTPLVLKAFRRLVQKCFTP